MNFLSSCPALALPNTDSLFASKQLKVQALVRAKDFLCFHLALTQLEFLGSRQSSLTRNSSSTQGIFDISAWGAATAAWGHRAPDFAEMFKFPWKIMLEPPSHISELTFHSQNPFSPAIPAPWEWLGLWVGITLLDQNSYLYAKPILGILLIKEFV